MGRKWATKQDYLCYNGSELKKSCGSEGKNNNKILDYRIIMACQL